MQFNKAADNFRPTLELTRNLFHDPFVLAVLPGRGAPVARGEVAPLQLGLRLSARVFPDSGGGGVGDGGGGGRGRR